MSFTECNWNYWKELRRKNGQVLSFDIDFSSTPKTAEQNETNDKIHCLLSNSNVFSRVNDSTEVEDKSKRSITITSKTISFTTQLEEV